MADGGSNQLPKETFDVIWCRLVRSMNERWQPYFISRNSGEYSSPTRWDLCPDTVKILKQAGAWSSGEQIIMGCLVSFYNSDDGQQLLDAVGHPNFVSALSSLCKNQQDTIFDLIRTYEGW